MRPPRRLAPNLRYPVGATPRSSPQGQSSRWVFFFLSQALGLPPAQVRQSAAASAVILVTRECPEARARGATGKTPCRPSPWTLYSSPTPLGLPHGSMLCPSWIHHFDHGVSGSGSVDGGLSLWAGRFSLTHPIGRGQEIVLIGTERRSAKALRPSDRRFNSATIVETEIDGRYGGNISQQATIILLRPQTGEILAMAIGDLT